MPLQCTRETNTLYNTRRGRSRAQHVRERDVDIERAKNGGCAFVERRRKSEWRSSKGRVEILGRIFGGRRAERL